MAPFGSQSEPGGSRFGRTGKTRAGRKSKRKWTPEPGASQAKPWSEQSTRFEQSAPPQTPPRTAKPAQPLNSFYDDHPAEPTPRPRPTPTPPRGTPTADDAPTGAVPLGYAAAPHRGARPYPPSDPSQRRTEQVRRDRPPPPRRPGTDEYEHYDTGGYAGEPYAGDPGGPGDPGRPGKPGDETEVHPPGPGSIPKLPRKITVTRVAALRGRQLTGQAVGAFQRATKADGADKSGLTALTYAVMLNYASDAAMAIALANTLFFAAAAGEGKSKVALYLLITIAPFALVAPVIGPALDKIQRGRRLAMCVSSVGQGLMAVIMAMHFDDWGLYPAALGMMVLSKSFTVLKAAVTPRVVPPDITLSKTNARLTIFGLAAAGAFGAIASGFNGVFGSAGALWFTAAICVAAAVQSMRIPAWVEVTEGEVPASLSAHPEKKKREKKKRQPMGRHVIVSLWGNGTIRVLTGFLMMFAAFAIKAQTEGSGKSPFMQLLLLGVIGAGAGVGGFVGNALGARMQFGKPDQVIVGSVTGALLSAVLATVLPGLATAAIVGLVGATASALAKISLDAVIQEDLPEESRASAFGRSETVLQMAWCIGGAVGLLLPPVYWIGFLVLSIMLAVGLLQTFLVRRGTSLIPGLGGDRPLRPGPTPTPPRGTSGGATGGPAASSWRAGS